jgi:uncharacterized protein
MKMADDSKRIAGIIAAEINAKPEQALAAIGLLDEGSTVPFVARYRKEVTGGLDDTQLRQLSERLAYLRELEARRTSILESIRSQEKLTPELELKIANVQTKIFICPTSRSAAPVRKSLVNAALDLWPRRSSPIAALCLPR